MWSYFEGAADAASSAYNVAADIVSDTTEAVSDYFWPEEEDQEAEPGYLDWDYWFPGTDPVEDDGDQPSTKPISECPYAGESDKKKSLYIDISWMFTGGAPSGTYNLVVAGQAFNGFLNGGAIRLDEELDSLCGSGEIEIQVAGGPTYHVNLHLDLPNVQEVAGIKRRLTNMGYYAGTTDTIDNRLTWAIRAFKRKVMNGFTRNNAEQEIDDPTATMLTRLMNEYGNGQQHVGDIPAVPPSFSHVPGNTDVTGMFGDTLLRRGSFENTATPDDRDPDGAGNNGIFNGVAAAGRIPIAGMYDLYLRAFDPHAGEPAMYNAVALPQPVHMTQMVVFELGYWLIAGSHPNVTSLNRANQSRARTLSAYTPTGTFDRFTQWALREFQCYAKSDTAAMEDRNSTDDLYIKRIISWGPRSISEAANARYPNDGRISGATNDATRVALQRWVDYGYRCPVICYSTTDNPTGVDMDDVQHDNIWSFDEFQSGSPRCYAIDFSSFYDIPAQYRQNATWNGITFREPIVMGGWTRTRNRDGNGDPRPGRYDDLGGPVTLAWYDHAWASEFTEVRPDTLVNPDDPGDGSTLSATELSTFKVIRTASHYECLGYLDTLNAYDRVTMSFGTCHWTLAWNIAGNATEPREMGAMFAYFRSIHPNAYFRYYGKFGLFPTSTWPISLNGSRTYTSTMQMQTESGSKVLAGASGALEENHYCHTWHSYYRFQMACRTSTEQREAMWDFARYRVRDILSLEIDVDGVNRRIGDFARSEKSVAMVHRWHIFSPSTLISRGLRSAIRNTLTGTTIPPGQPPQDRENLFRAGLVAAVTGNIREHIPEINNFTNVPQSTSTFARRLRYSLTLANPVLSGDVFSIRLSDPDAPPPPPPPPEDPSRDVPAWD